jgi:hypothetical protein
LRKFKQFHSNFHFNPPLQLQKFQKLNFLFLPHFGPHNPVIISFFFFFFFSPQAFRPLGLLGLASPAATFLPPWNRTQAAVAIGLQHAAAAARFRPPSPYPSPPRVISRRDASIPLWNRWDLKSTHRWPLKGLAGRLTSRPSPIKRQPRPW